MGKAKVIVLGAVCIALASGCARPKPTILPVEGVVRIDGQPLKKVVVQFISKNEQYSSEWIASGMTDDAGHYTLKCNGQPGACAGENQVLVIESPPPSLPMDERGHPRTGDYYQSLGGRPIPRKYGNVVESPLTWDVKAGQKDYDVELAR